MKRVFLFFFSVFFLISCYPEGAENIEDYDLALTNYDQSKGESYFKDLKTYSLPDTIVYFIDRKSTFVFEHQFDDNILNIIERNFQERGYIKIDGSTGNIPDFIVTVSAFSRLNYYHSYANWYKYWSWYPGWDWYNLNLESDWGVYYPWGNIANATYRSGTLIIDILQPQNATNKQIPVIWSGVAEGLIAGESENLQSRAQTLINQCFEQSPYLQAD